jgi:hypothetical protein
VLIPAGIYLRTKNAVHHAAFHAMDSRLYVFMNIFGKNNPLNSGESSQRNQCTWNCMTWTSSTYRDRVINVSNVNSTEKTGFSTDYIYNNHDSDQCNHVTRLLDLKTGPWRKVSNSPRVMLMAPHLALLQTGSETTMFRLTARQENSFPNPLKLIASVVSTRCESFAGYASAY